MTINTIDTKAPGRAHVDSCWASNGGPETTDAPPVSGKMEVEAAVVGGGFAGLSTAFHLGCRFGVTTRVRRTHQRAIYASFELQDRC